MAGSALELLLRMARASKTVTKPAAPRFHLLGLRGGLVEPRLELRTAMFPSLADGGTHIISQDDELGRSAVVKGAKAYDIDLSHSGRKIAKKQGESKRANLN
jgi:hypothetical protein